MRSLLPLLLLLPGAARPPPGADTAVLASLHRTGCEGTCPDYTLTIHADGLAEFDSQDIVKVFGHHERWLTSQELESLKSAFAESDYFGANPPECGIIDVDAAVTCYRGDLRCKCIMRVRGCNTPRDQQLEVLEKQIDALTHSIEWVGTHEERREIMDRLLMAR